MNKLPPLGICIPLFNSEEKIKNVIMSIKNQKYSNFHAHIFDDCSTDKSISIVKDICNNDERFFIHQNNINLGQAGNFNSCFNLYCYKYVSIKSDNDIISDDYYDICIKFLENNEEYVSCYTNASNTEDMKFFTSYDNDNIYIRLHDIILGDCPGNMNYGVIRGNILQKLYKWQYLQGNDHIFNFNVAMMGKLKKIDKVLYYRYIDKKRNTLKYKNTCCSGFSKYYGDKFPTLKLIDMIYGYFKIIDYSYLNSLDPETIGSIVIKSMYERFGSRIDKEKNILYEYLERFSKNKNIQNRIINEIGSKYIFKSEINKLHIKYCTVKDKIDYFKHL